MKEIKLKTIGEIMDNVPLDQIDNFLHDFKLFLKTHKKISELCIEVGHNMKPSETTEDGAFYWINDLKIGCKSVEIKIIDK